jgi:hypothetical protein
LHWLVLTGISDGPGTSGLARQRPVTTSITGPPDWVMNHWWSGVVVGGLVQETAKTSPVALLLRHSPLARSRMVLVVLERVNTHCCDREPVHATLKTLWRALLSVSRQKVVPMFRNVETVHNGMIDVADTGQAMATEGCGVGSGGQGGGQGGGQIGMTVVAAGASVIGQTMAPEGCGEDRTGHGGGQAMTSLPAAGGAALAIAGSATPKTTEAMIATTASIPRVMLAILAMSGSPFLVGTSNHRGGSGPKANGGGPVAEERTSLNPTRDSHSSANRAGLVDSVATRCDDHGA